MNSAREFATDIVKKLKAHGFEAVFAGGCVRDVLLKREPKDFDVATNAMPDDIRKIFARTVPVGEAFNVMLVLDEEPERNPLKVEVATFRKDIGVKDGRHPERVEVATAKEDVARRDFTINGMLMDPVSGEIFDWVGGQKDLAAGILRSIGEPELRIDEDHLRMLRAVRFAARFDYQMDAALAKAIQKKAALIKKISAERIYDEMTKILTSANADRAMNDAADLGLLEHFLPEALPMKGCEQPPEYHPEGDVWVHTLMLLKQADGDVPAIGWAALLHDIGKPPTFSHEPPDRIRFNNHTNVGAEMSEVILRRFKASTALIEVVSELVRDHLKFKDVPQMRPSTLKRFLRNPNFDLHLRLHYMDCMASHEDLTLYKLCIEKRDELSKEQLSPPPLLRGKDLIDLGFQPGPLFKTILTAVETEQLEGRLSSNEDAVEFVKKNYRG